VERDDGLRRLRGYGLSAADAELLWAHFDDAERRGKEGHGHSRIDWLATQHFDPLARPELVEDEPELQRWRGTGALGYLVVAAAVEHQRAAPPERARLVVCEQTFPSGALGYWVRHLADAGLVALATATSPPRLGAAGGPKLAGTNPLAIGIPSSDGQPLVSDVSWGRVTYGDVLAGAATEEELVPFGAEHAHKAFAVAIALQLLVDSLVGDGFGAVLLVARPAADPVPALRVRAPGVRLPGDA
jgi:LDH2 family malate/lactate/ureidoglycolate dehydrogenase